MSGTEVVAVGLTGLGRRWSRGVLRVWDGAFRAAFTASKMGPFEEGFQV